MRGHQKVVETLLTYHAVLEDRDKNGHNALHCSCYSPRASVEVLKLLIKAGASVNSLTKVRRRAFD
jgi:ankyrin repeat protein